MGIFDRIKSQSTQSLADEQSRAANPATGNAPAHSVSFVKQASPAVDRQVVLTKGGVDFTKRYDKAGTALSKLDLTGMRAEAIMLLDHSGSMIADYENGTVQTLVERALGFALQVDTDGTIPVIRYDSGVRKAIDVTLDNYATITQTKLYERNKMGSTNLTAALDQILAAAKETTQPLFVIIVTDGAPNDPTTVIQRVRELSRYPVFLKFLSIQKVAFLDRLDNLDGVFIDACDAQDVLDPANISDLIFAEKMTEELAKWVSEAQRVGILQ